MSVSRFWLAEVEELASLCSERLVVFAARAGCVGLAFALRD
jgi:hypothetical protein